MPARLTPDRGAVAQAGEVRDERYQWGVRSKVASPIDIGVRAQHVYEVLKRSLGLSPGVLDLLRRCAVQGLEQARIVTEPVSGQEFFNLLLSTAMEGFFSDPVYGGNRDKVSWKMLGFPGVIAIYSEHIKTYRNRKYDVEPTSIADLS